MWVFVSVKGPVGRGAQVQTYITAFLDRCNGWRTSWAAESS